MTPKIGIDFRKGSCAKSKSYSVLCASKRTRGAVVSNYFLPGPLRPGSIVARRLEAGRYAEVEFLHVVGVLLEDRHRIVDADRAKGRRPH
ncbi:MAG: hypothetical protein EOR78_00990 [Mesorhizobium sp.]|nr:MAG: hypothetical protein EOR49_01855 [Mesorhizobium sp.]RWM52927.1 MAG: hypothetical protein EOR76_02710 [Mesorhizobium sp.]RWM60571.1 MAG: hypothetical protein EOR78_00990 [Mesorhizobium sp.]RWM62233.1 MAG: hypothetical protein EOR79_01440 [Mesorhizobium sp.]RWM83401.1 MAG: hypothetical protein EOR81_00095 [Mesorhizobium sp.]